jgi:hypothetical protein
MYRTGERAKPMLKTLISLAVLLAAGLPAAAATRVPPQAGIYAITNHTDVVHPPSCKSNPYRFLAYGILYFPGAGASGAVIRRIYATGTGTPIVRTTSLPVTPADLENTWSGNVTISEIPANTPTATGTFTARLTLFDDATFEATTNVFIAGCHFYQKLFLQRTGS